ncbi:MAG: class II fructose-bisphosphate aldolase [Candidatus Omnitrophica bacterium]|nr:class II fructose-bisphosphate aldolase [Candidatus Omnitrophota bacterium]
MSKATKNIDDLVSEIALADNIEKKREFAGEILELGYARGVYPSSINELYMARGRGEFTGFTVPAINLRTITYDLARAIFRAAKKINAGAFIFEIAKSEMGYTAQPPAEYASVCIAAAIKENYKGPVFIQGDHFQVNTKKFKEDPTKEIGGMKDLIEHAVEAGFYNIDIDSSTLVDLSQPTVEKEQELNNSVCAELTNFIRSIQPEGIEISVGGEIGEVGKKNSTPEELRAFMGGFYKKLKKGNTGISKISIQTGTAHGGVVLPDGSIAKVKLDFDTLKNMSEVARKEFGMAGAVQHGASTLPPEAFGKFSEVETAEVHLATEFQNMVYESKSFPSDLRERIYGWIRKNLATEKKTGETDEQFIYKARKKALGPFKKDILGISAKDRDNIAKEVEKKFDFLFGKLNIRDTHDIVSKYVTLKRVSRDKAKKAKRIELTGEGDD